jgi:ribonuclease P protein component
VTELGAGGVETLRRRADFLAAARGRRRMLPGFALQARERTDDEPAAGIRIGFTCSRKVGGAVARNRAKRRLRAVAREVLPEHGRPGWDYVLVGRAGTTATRPYPRLRDDLAAALAALHAEGRRR